MDARPGLPRGRDQVRRSLRDEDIGYGSLGGQRVAERQRPLEEEAQLPVAENAARQFPRRLNGGVLKTSYAAQDAFSSDCFATSASAVNACGSLTASSARIFLSTSTSAMRSPAIKRL